MKNLSLKITIFWQFLLLGLVSFGGPVAHIGYFQKAFVERLKWLDQQTFMSLNALCQLLPGPASSQLGFAIGLKKGGLLGALAAFLGFTLPSFLIMAAIAIYTPENSQWLGTTITGLKLAAVIIVADACITLFNKFCDNPYRRGIAAVTTLALLAFSHPLMPIALLIIAACAGQIPSFSNPLKRKFNVTDRSFWCASIFIAFWLVPLGAALINQPLLSLWAQFYEAGSLVFGGGHVVLPLLQQQIGDALSTDQFLTGYASAQAVPGPMFTFASYLGAELFSSSPWTGAVIATLAIFMPGFLLILMFERHWQHSLQSEALTLVFARVNAAVVGLLLATLINPVMSSSLASGGQTAMAIIGLIALRLFKLPVLAILAATIAYAWAAALW